MLRHISNPKIDRLPDADPESDHRAKQFDRFQVMLGDQQHQLFQFLERIFRNFFAHQTTDIEFRNRRGQALPRGIGNSYCQRGAGFFNGAFGHVNMNVHTLEDIRVNAEGFGT